MDPLAPDLSDDYAVIARTPGGDLFPPRWERDAAAFRAAHPPETLATGPHERERLDLFHPGGEPRGLLVFVHGGYWMRFGRESFSWVARGALARGWAVALPSYPLCPEVSVGAIVLSVARSVDAAAARVPGPVVVAGHSAGGHVAARLACADVPLAPRARLARVVPVSPLSLLLPLRRTAMNDALRLDAAEALAQSPALRPRPSVPVRAWVGAGERPVFLLQARWLRDAWGCALTVEEGRHHLDVIEGLADPAHPLLRAALDG